MTKCVLITPAHNEEAFIAKTIESVVAQTVRPIRWVVVNDASTDATPEIVERFARRHDFIRLVNVARASGRHFGNKVRAFNRGLEELQGLDFDYIGNLDADISFDPDYVENVLRELEHDPTLGIAGGIVHTRVGEVFKWQIVAPDSVPGAVQMFRRSCFEEIGGYLALPYGGIDAAAEITARCYGWKVRSFPEYRVFEHRRTGSATYRPLAGRLAEGRRMHSLGYGFLFFLARQVTRAMEPPKLLGSAAALYSFAICIVTGEPMVLPREIVRFLRAEQREKLKRLLRVSAQG